MALELPPVSLYLIRHGQADINLVPGLVAGRSTPSPLTELGREQAAKVGIYLADVGIFPTQERTFTSNAVRAIETGRIALDTMELFDVQPVATEEIHEQNLGAANEGQPRDEVYTAERKAESAILEKAFKLPGGESMAELGDRMTNWVQKTAAEVMAENASEDPFVAVSHNGSINSFAGQILGWSRDYVRESMRNMPNASISRFIIDNGEISVDYVGRPTQ